MNLSFASFLALMMLASNSVTATIRGTAKNSTTALERDLGVGGRIVGGRAASQGEFPFFVEWNGCGASLIHSDIVLSAAHCNSIRSNTLYVGAYKDQSTQGGAQIRTISDRVVHPSFSRSTLNYDFLILKLNSPVSITPIQLNADANSPVSNEVLTVIGFGTTSNDDDSTPTTLRKVDVNYIDTNTCNDLLNENLKASVELCAGVEGGGKDSCFGDSGGPIFTSNKVQVGVVSYADGSYCAEDGSPGIYSRISGAIDWINEKICELSSDPPASCFGGNPAPAPVKPVRKPTRRPTHRPTNRRRRPTPRPARFFNN